MNFDCPRCGHKAFYFNYFKKVGYCHHDKCHWKPTLDDLFERVGEKLEDAVWDDLSPNEGPAPKVEVTLPETAKRLVELEDGKLNTKYPTIILRLKEDRTITIEQAYNFNLYTGGCRIYIPVYLEGELVNWVGRALWWPPFEGALRYKYPRGTKVTDYLFNWDTAKTWDRLTLVENTFNAIWLHKHYVTSNFGSHLSDSQCEHILRGRARSVVLLWDRGAESSAHKAVKKLRSLGVQASYGMIDGQPDDHSEPEIVRWIQELHQAAQAGTTCLNLRKTK